jgi:hypothetical protein
MQHERLHPEDSPVKRRRMMNGEENKYSVLSDPLKADEADIAESRAEQVNSDRTSKAKQKKKAKKANKILHVMI